ncbi:MAG: tetratricopeptide repeat protein [Deltaproteobacteria bacterium]|nr:tetratricopeptide repeat protein [Deltaproteobacteria bacterium]
MSARKKLKKMTMKEVKAPDEFQTTVAKTVEFLREYGSWVFGGIAVILVIILGGIILTRYQKSSEIDEALAFNKAFAGVAEATVLEPKGATDGGPDDAEKKAEKLKAAAGQLEKFSKDYQGTPLAALALFARGAADLNAGDTESAYKDYRTYLDSAPDKTLSFIAWEALGIAADRLGKRKEAEEAFNEMSKAGSSFLRANAFLHLGDLYNAATAAKDDKTDAAKARGFYESGVKELAGEPKTMPPAMLLTRRTLEQRIAALP